MRDQVSLGPILDEEFTDREIQPKTLELRLKRVICHEDFKNEWGKDELIFAAVAHDIYHRQDIEFAPRELGKFKKGDNKPLNDLLIASIPVAQGSWRDAAYPVALYLAEKALGGFAKAVEELRGLSSHEMRDLFLLLHAVSLFSLMGMSVAAEKGFDAHGLAKALSIGLGPLVYCALYIGIVASSWPIALAWLGVVGQDKLLAVLGLGLLETIGDALKDDLFPPQAIAFHFGVPDGLGDAGALDFGSPTRVVQPFKFIQKGLARGRNVVHYDLEFEWRVVPGIGEASPPPPPAEETDDPILARGNLLLQNVANPGNAEFAAQIAQLQDIMGYYPAEAAPTFDLSATEFAVCDRWYSSYPGNTWVNRTFSLTGWPARQENFARDIDKDIDKDERDAMLAALEGTEHEDHAKFITDNDMPFDEVSFSGSSISTVIRTRPLTGPFTRRICRRCWRSTPATPRNSATACRAAPIVSAPWTVFSRTPNRVSYRRSSGWTPILWTSGTCARISATGTPVWIPTAIA